MKRIVFMIILAIGCLAGCKGKEETAVQVDSAVIYTRGQGFSKEGITFVEDEIIQYTDFSTGATMPLCSRLNCSHRVLTMDETENGAEPCMAYVKDAYQAVLYRERLYVFTENGGGLGIYVSEADGTNRKLLAELPNISWTGGFNTEFYKDRLVLVANRSEKSEGENGEIEITTYTGIYSIDCETGKMTVCEKEWDDRVALECVDDTSVYVYYNHIDEEIYETYTKEELENDSSLYDEYHKVELWQCNLEDGSAIELCAGTFGSYCYPIAVHKDGVIIYTVLEDGTEEYSYRPFSGGTEVTMPFDSLRVLLMEEDYALITRMEGQEGEEVEVIYRCFYKDGTVERVETDASLTPSRMLGGNLYCIKEDLKSSAVSLDVFLSGGSEELYVMERTIYDTIK